MDTIIEKRLARIDALKEKCFEELERIMTASHADEEGGWKGVSKVVHALSALSDEQLRELRIQAIKDENAAIKAGTCFSIGFRDPVTVEVQN